MEIKVVRDKFTEDTTYGKMYLDGKFFCYTLEDKDRGLDKTDSKGEIKEVKVIGRTAVPAGKYRVVLSYSIKLKRFLPLLLSVPLGKGIRIHKGSSNEWTSGCILVGHGISKTGKLTGIKQAELDLMKVLKEANLVGPLYITIERNGTLYNS